MYSKMQQQLDTREHRCATELLNYRKAFNRSEVIRESLGRYRDSDHPTLLLLNITYVPESKFEF